MQLILLSKNRGHLAQLHLSSRRVSFGLVGLALAICAGFFYGGFRAAASFGVANPETQVQQWRTQLEGQEEVLQSTRRSLQQNIDALALRLGQMNAHVVRLDALGARLTQMADLNDGEFDFTTPPSLGGPEEPLVDTDVIMMLRLQKERMRSALLPSEQEYFQNYGLTEKRLAAARADAIVMHPGPINRGVEIDSHVADGKRSVILQQVSHGIAARMAVMAMTMGSRAGQRE